MKNLNEVQALQDVLKVQAEQLKLQLSHPVRQLLTLDAQYLAEREVATITAQLNVLSWIAA